MPINQTSVWNGSQWVTMGGVVDTASNYNWAGSHNFAQSAIFQDDVRVKSLNGGQLAGFRNKIINGGFDIWQRGVSIAGASGYCVDRWYAGAGASTTVSRQSSGQALGSQYHARIAYTASSAFCNMHQMIETSEVSKLWGRQVTASVKLRRNSTMSGGMDIAIYKSSTVDASISATWTLLGYTRIDNSTIPTGTTSADWYTLSTTVTVPNDGTANSLRFTIAETAVSPSGAYYEISQAQLEEGSVVTPFEERYVGTELTLCQRYYEVVGGTSTAGITLGGVATAANQAFYFPYSFVVTKRISPTLSKTGTWGVSNAIQPQVAFPQPSGFTLYGQSLASGMWYAQADSIDDTVVASAEL